MTQSTVATGSDGTHGFIKSQLWQSAVQLFSAVAIRVLSYIPFCFLVHVTSV